MNARKLSGAVLLLSLICFFLPFFTFSCQGHRVLTLSGVQLATGTTIQQPQMLGPPKPQKINPEPLAILAVVSVIVGLGLSFLKGKKGAVGSGALAGLGAIFLLTLKSKIEGDVLKQAAGMIQVNSGMGFYLVLCLLLGAIGTNAYAFFARSGPRLPSFQSGAAHKFCTQCGARSNAADLFCKECGTKFA